MTRPTVWIPMTEELSASQLLAEYRWWSEAHYRAAFEEPTPENVALFRKWLDKRHGLRYGPPRAKYETAFLAEYGRQVAGEAGE